MKFGMTREEAQEFKRQESRKRYEWFAWRPVWLNDGSVVWLERAIRYKVFKFYYITDLDYFWVYEKYGKT